MRARPAGVFLRVVERAVDGEVGDELCFREHRSTEVVDLVRLGESTVDEHVRLLAHQVDERLAGFRDDRTHVDDVAQRPVLRDRRHQQSVGGVGDDDDVVGVIWDGGADHGDVVFRGGIGVVARQVDGDGGVATRVEFWDHLSQIQDPSPAPCTRTNTLIPTELPLYGRELHGKALHTRHERHARGVEQHRVSRRLDVGQTLEEATEHHVDLAPCEVRAEAEVRTRSTEAEVRVRVAAHVEAVRDRRTRPRRATAEP